MYFYLPHFLKPHFYPALPPCGQPTMLAGAFLVYSHGPQAVTSIIVETASERDGENEVAYRLSSVGKTYTSEVIFFAMST